MLFKNQLLMENYNIESKNFFSKSMIWKHKINIKYLSRLKLQKKKNIWVCYLPWLQMYKISIETYICTIHA
jgi:hypothetical protein